MRFRPSELSRARRWLASAALALAVASGCSRDSPSSSPGHTPGGLRVGFGLSTGQNPAAGLRQAVRNVALEGLVSPTRSGRVLPRLADGWALSDDGLTLRVTLKSGVRFHDGQPLTAEAVRASLLTQLRAYMGPVADDIDAIEAVSPLEIVIRLKRRSNFVIEALDGGIAAPGHPMAGTGAFVAGEPGDGGRVMMTANPGYRDGAPLLGRLEFRPYTSVRAAWADLLRGEVDMLYEVGSDALDSLEASTRVRVFSYPRNYAYLLLLNVRRPELRDPVVRRRLNAAIDRQQIVAQALGGHGTPAEWPIRQEHWAHDPDAPRFAYDPVPLEAPLRLTCLFGDASLERLAVMLQRQLQAVGVELQLQRATVDQIYERNRRGDFDILLADTAAGPTMVRLLWFWSSGAEFNWGGYSNPSVDRAFDAIREARSDDDYRAGVSAFERAMVNDPPAVFIAWSERARAISTAFEVPEDPGRDVLASLPRWRLRDTPAH